MPSSSDDRGDDSGLALFIYLSLFKLIYFLDSIILYIYILFIFILRMTVKLISFLAFLRFWPTTCMRLDWASQKLARIEMNKINPTLFGPRLEMG